MNPSKVLSCFQSAVLTFSFGLVFFLSPVFGAVQDKEGRIWLTPHQGVKQNHLEFMVDAEMQAHKYVFRIITSKETPPQLFLNGEKLDVDPLASPAGYLFGLSGGFFEEGLNTLEIRSPDKKLIEVKSLEGFSLIDSYEEERPLAAFGGVEYRQLLDQPPTDPDQDKYDVLHYDLDLVLDMNDEIVDATLEMTAQSLDSTLQTVPLDLNDNGGQMSVAWVDEGEGISSLSYTHNGSSDRVFITLPAPVPVGAAFTVRVKYSGRPSTSAGVFGTTPYNVSTHNGTPVVYTISQPYNGRTWWPCKDVPEDKATMDIHLTCPTSYIPVSNGRLDSIAGHGDGTHTYHWMEEYPIATYLVSLACTNYQKASTLYTATDGTTTMEVSHYLYPENYSEESGSVAQTRQVLDFFADLYGEYPFLTEKYSTATWNISFGMEHQTVTSLPELELYPDGYSRRNVHELSHMWFGDSVSPGHYDHIWLNEGFATYSEALWYEHSISKAYYHSYVNAWSTSDAYPIVSTSADNMSGSIVYRKGAWVLHMLRHVMEYHTGDEQEFFEAVRDYYQLYKDGNAWSDDLQQVFEARAGVSLEYFFQQWLYRAARPSYEWSWSWYEDSGDKVLNISIEQTQSGDAFTMPIDIRVHDSGGGQEIHKVFNNQKSQTFQIVLGATTPVDVDFDPLNWVLDGGITQTGGLEILSVRDVQADSTSLAVRWGQDVSAGVSGYELYRSTDLQTWTLVADENTLTQTVTSYVDSGLATGEDYYYRIRSVGSVTGPYTDVYGARTTAGLAQVLILEGFDRWDDQYGGSFEGVYYHGDAIDAYGMAFDTCDNDEVGSTVNLSDYPIVIYVLGEESTVDESFSDNEQVLAAAYLDGGGYLFVSGAEIGWDLDYRGDTSDKAFYNNYLRADYYADASDTTQAAGQTGSILSSLPTFNYGTGSGHSYYIQYADQLTPLSGAVVCLSYIGGLGGNAGIQYEGDYRLVYLGFPFETIVEETTRHDLMAASLSFFEPAIISGWDVY